MQLTLYVPGLLLPGEVLRDTVFDLTAPTLSLLLGRGQRHALDPEWLPTAFGLNPPLPAAALRKVGAGGMKCPVAGTATGDWLCLDPVHWQVTREGITLDDPARLALREEEATALIAAVQPLFAELGTITPSAPGCWELQLTQSLALETRPLPETIGQRIDPRLPGGADGPTLRRLLAEAQTVLHAHPVNRNRDALGQPTVNSLWPWGQGQLPADIQANFNVVWSDDAIVAGLCEQAGMPCIAPPGGFQPASGRVLAIVAALARPARTLDALAWREALLGFEKQWLVPAVMALKKGTCREFRLIGTHVNGTPASVAFSATRGELRRFWRKPQPLTALA